MAIFQLFYSWQCVKQGKIRATGQVITCLPNKLTVTDYGGEDSGVDLVS